MNVEQDLYEPIDSSRNAQPPFAYLFALTAVGLAVFSRVVVAYGGLPAFLNFVHFPFTILGLITQRQNVRFWRYSGGFIGWVAFSALINGVEPLRALLASVVWLEPLIVGYVVWQAVQNVAGKQGRWIAIGRSLLWGIIGAQFVLMPIQYFESGGPDRMQGSFVGSGTGAHVSAALALVGSTVFLHRLGSLTRRRALLRLSLLVFGVALAVLGSARAVVATWVVAIVVSALVVIVRTLRRKERVSSVQPILALGAALLAAILLINLTTGLFRQTNLDRVLSTKWQGTVRVFETMADPAVFVAGQGPGMTLSRVALETPEARLNPNSPIALLGIPTSDFTRDIVSFTGAQGGRSSLFAPWTSIVGIIGDLGMIGTVLYGLAWFGIVRHSIRSGAIVIMVLILMTFLLGIQQIYLEDPGYILPVALLLGLSAAHGGPNWLVETSKASAHQEHRPGYRSSKVQPSRA